MALRIIKLGGSLLDLPDLVPRLHHWLRQNPAEKSLVLIGGGQLVESVRTLDGIHQLEVRFVHWQCVELLKHTAVIVSRLFPEFGVISNADQLHQFLSSAATNLISIIHVDVFYRSDCLALPENWDTTSDSLAAYLACEQSADELVLLKSAPAPSASWSLDQWSAAGMVDRSFPAVARQIPLVRISNLRRASPPQ